jgi:hypothetical protein
MTIFDEENNVSVELYDVGVAGKEEEDRFGRILTTQRLKEDDLIRLAASRRADLSPEALRASIDALKEIAVENLLNGASVELGLGFFHLAVQGVFTGNHPKWNPDKHSLKLQAIPNADLRNLVKEINVNVVSVAPSGPVIHSIFDSESGEKNTHLTANGAVTITGSKIKIVGDHSVSGLTLAYANKEGFFRIPSIEMLVNNPSEVTFIVPPLPPGAYRLSITTHYYSEHRMHKKPRTGAFDYPLTLS